MEYPVLKLKKGHEKRVRAGHLWVYSNEIEKIDKTLPVGCLVDVINSKDEFVGTGFFNPNSLITVRLLTRKKEPIDREFFSKRLKTAREVRETLCKNRTAYRLVHSESDFLPGLVIDKYNDSFSIQLNSAGMENYLDIITNLLVRDFNAKNIILRNDTTARELEGLPRFTKILYGENVEEIIFDGKLKMKVNLLEGQKTGIYLDQTENRHILIDISQDAEVLDVFCNEGGFSLSALLGGAKKVTSIDISDESLQRFKENIELNGLDINKVEMIKKDAFDLLKVFKKEGRKFDVINLDPPSFTKTKKNVPQAKKGYYVINNHAFNMIKEGGYILTSSCSHHMSENDFQEIVLTAALKAGRQYMILKTGGPAIDHPVHPRMPETRYLKFMLLKVIN
ncbi:MAG: class I SAM-dependent rRNA methyltransferase [Ignavibacteria bacterium]|nr:class I SAM-dependent rRNA methyltransferase [Ignavibacteria bacterium]